MYPGLVSCPFYAIPIYPFKFLKFFLYLLYCTVPQTIRFQNSLFLFIDILMCASASIGMYYISKLSSIITDQSDYN